MQFEAIDDAFDLVAFLFMAIKSMIQPDKTIEEFRNRKNFKMLLN
jgi:hypothetical protein